MSAKLEISLFKLATHKRLCKIHNRVVYRQTHTVNLEFLLLLYSRVLIFVLCIISRQVSYTTLLIAY